MIQVPHQRVPTRSKGPPSKPIEDGGYQRAVVSAFGSPRRDQSHRQHRYPTCDGSSGRDVGGHCLARSESHTTCSDGQAIAEIVGADRAAGRKRERLATEGEGHRRCASGRVAYKRNDITTWPAACGTGRSACGTRTTPRLQHPCASHADPLQPPAGRE